MIVLPIQKNTTSFITDLTLDNKIYKFKYMHNIRDVSWSLNIFDQANVALLEGIKLVTDWEFLQRFKDELLPPGALFALDTIGNGQPISKEDLGKRIKMIYLTKDEVVALTAPPSATAVPLTAAPP